MSRYYRLRKLNGFSLLELVLVLGIIAALVVGAYLVYKKVDSDRRANSVVQKIGAVAGNYKSLYSGVANPTSTSNDKAVFDYLTDGIYKKTSISVGGASSSGYMADNSFLMIHSSDNYLYMELIVDKDICTKVVTSLLAQAQYIITPDSTTGSSSSYANPATNGLSSLPGGAYYITSYTPSMISNDCSQNISSDLSSALGDGFSHIADINLILMP